MAHEVIVETRKLTEETLDFYGRLFNLAPATRRSKAQELIERVGLKNDRKRPLKEYSKGMRQRIGLAQALINNPELVILDEPTSGLDPLGARWMKNLIVDLRKQGKTVIMCSHRLEDVQDVCDRIAILHEGELQAYGEVKELLQDVNRVDIQASGLQMTDALRRDLEEVLTRHGGKLDSFGHPTTTLEDYFLRIVEESKTRPGRTCSRQWCSIATSSSGSSCRRWSSPGCRTPAGTRPSAPSSG
jgi:ABC-2 type transport system ATP-binding protein